MDYGHHGIVFTVKDLKVCFCYGKRISREHCGQRIVFDDRYLKCENDAYVVRLTANDTEIYRLLISQNESGVDVEDRIIKLRGVYQDILSQQLAPIPVVSDAESEDGNE